MRILISKIVFVALDAETWLARMSVLAAAMHPNPCRMGRASVQCPTGPNCKTQLVNATF